MITMYACMYTKSECMANACMWQKHFANYINDEETATSKNYYATEFQSYGFYMFAFHNDLLSPLIFLWNLGSVTIGIFVLLNYNIHIKEFELVPMLMPWKICKEPLCTQICTAVRQWS